MSLKIALLGNPNSGKTTLFNELTGSNAHVGNWPGVTVEKKEGEYFNKVDNEKALIVDLPGIYSLSPYTPEEVICRDYIMSNDSNIVVNIVDATNFERNLYLTTQILEMDIPVVIALNMMDVFEKQNNHIDLIGLSNSLGVPIIPISAAQKKGIDELMKTAIKESKRKRNGVLFFENNFLVNTIIKISNIFLNEKLLHPLYCAEKFIDKDASILLKYNLEPLTISTITTLRTELEEKIGDLEETIADNRYKYAEKLIRENLKNPISIENETYSDKIDKILTNRYLGIPIFIFIMFLIFHFTFTENLFFITGVPGIGIFFANVAEYFVSIITNSIEIFLISVNTPDWFIGLFVNGVLAGIGAVVGFIPLVLVLYFFISILEDTGYMSRAAFIMDRLLRKFGLSGKSFLPLMMGFGCSVPAIAATRTIENERDRRLTIMLIPFMSCSAKIPIYALLVPIFFTNYADLVMTLIYVLGIVVAVCVGIILKKTLFKGDPIPFIMELPQYRLPTLKSIRLYLWDKFQDFVKKVGTVIALATIVIWFLSNFGFENGFGMVEANSAHSLLGYMGNVLRIIFIPLGFASGPDGWKTTVSILSGFVAREAVVSTLGQLFYVSANGASASENLAIILRNMLSIPAALSFIAWNLLSVPCIAAVSAISREMKSRSWFFKVIFLELITAWVVSFIVYCLGSLIIML